MLKKLLITSSIIGCLGLVSLPLFLAAFNKPKPLIATKNDTKVSTSTIPDTTSSPLLSPSTTSLTPSSKPSSVVPVPSLSIPEDIPSLPDISPPISQPLPSGTIADPTKCASLKAERDAQIAPLDAQDTDLKITITNYQNYIIGNSGYGTTKAPDTSIERAALQVANNQLYANVAQINAITGKYMSPLMTNHCSLI